MLQQALLFTLIPLAAAVASGVVALFYTPGPGARSYIQHFAAASCSRTWWRGSST